MSKFKKMLSLVLALTLVLGSMGSVFADAPEADEELKTVPTDVIGTEYEKAVSKLVSFSVLDGYPDGTYRPENDVTRAQFAKILVEALGIGNAADAAIGTTDFDDVNAGGYNWATGYINVAVGQGILKGYPDGTFKPGRNVKYSEALTMLVRALGYQDEFLKGSWPGNYIAKAAETGITSGVKFSDANGAANRGKVAQLVSNVFDAEVVKVKTYDGGRIEYEETDVTLLKDKLDISKYEDTRVVADKLVDDGLSVDEITVDFLKELTSKEKLNVKKDYGEEEKDFKHTSTVNPRKLIGEEVTTYINNNDRVVHIESENDDRANFDYAEELKGNNDRVKLVKFDKDYKFANDAKVFVHDGKDKFDERKGEDLTTSDLKGLLGKVGKFVVKNNEIIYAEVMTSSEALESMVVFENDKGLLKGVNQTTEDFDLDLRDKGNFDGVFVYDTEGNKLEVEDIKEGNVVYAQKLDYDGDDYAQVVVVKDNIVEGELTKVKVDNVTLDGKMVKITRYKDNGNHFQSYYSVEGTEDIKEWDNGDWDKDMEDADESEMVAYLDAVGKIVFLSTEAKGVSGYKYGIVTRTYADNDRVKIYTTIDGKNGEEITYRADKDRDLTNPKALDKEGNFDNSLTASSLVDGSVVKFKLNKNGEIADGEFYIMDPANAWRMEKDSNGKVKDFGKDSIPSTSLTTSNSKSFSIDDRATIIDAEGSKINGTQVNGEFTAITGLDVDDTDDFKISNWKDIADDKGDDYLRYYVFTKRSNNIDIDAIIFVGEDGLSTSSDEEAVYVLDKWSKGGDTYVKYVSYETGEVEEREVNKLDTNTSVGLNDIEKEEPYIAKIKTDGKIDLFTTNEGDLSYVKGKITSKNGNIIRVNGTEYRLSGSSVVYEEDVKKSTSNIREEDYVYFIVENGVNVRVIERLIKGEADRAEGEAEVLSGNITTKAGLDALQDAGVVSRNTTIDLVSIYGNDAKNITIKDLSVDTGFTLTVTVGNHNVTIDNVTGDIQLN